MPIPSTPRALRDGMTPRARRAALPLALLLPLPALAQTEAPAPIEAPEVVVGGGLTPVAAQSFARSVTIVTEEDLERRQPRTFADALRGVPGVSVSRAGGPGGETAVRIRGAESNHVLVLIDGIPSADSATGQEFAALSPALIERIEVLRGPQAAIYGAGATSGVINVVTRRARRGETSISGSLEGTTAPGGTATGLARSGSDVADIAFGVTYADDAGWDASGDGGEEDGARALGLSATGSADLADWGRLRGVFRLTDRSAGFDDTAFGCGGPDCYVVDAEGRRTDGTEIRTGLWLDIEALGGDLVHTPSVRYADEALETRAAFGPSTNDSSTLNLAWQSAWTFGDEGRHTLVGRAEVERATFSSSFGGGDVKTREQIGLVADYRVAVTDALFVQAGLRWDENDGFDDFLSWSASASYDVFDWGTRLRAAAGEAQTNPTFFEQFGFVPGQFVGNPDLKPERNLGWEVGVDQRLWNGRATLAATYFNETLEDEISGSGLTVDNLDGESDRQGVELSLAVRPLERLTLEASYTWLDATEPSGLREVRRPEHSGAVRADWSFAGGRGRIGADVVWSGEAEDQDFGDPSFASPRTTLDGWATVNVGASWRLTERAEVYGGIRNLFDAERTEVLGYAEAPITGFLGIRAAF